ncbi:MAG: hypothetical protein N3E37_01310 [Candidatus Micrarchaeota archaeon]|nr:hypothetical protein [Candidatus Micrarchaeota archaeon]
MQNNIKAQIATIEFVMASTAILFMYLFLTNYLNTLADNTEIEKNRAILRADIEKISTYTLSAGNPENWSIQSGVPGLLCTNNVVCQEKLDLFMQLCSLNYSRIKKSWNLNSDFSMKLINNSFSQCICNCGITNRKFSETDIISIPHNDTVYSIIISTYSLK